MKREDHIAYIKRLADLQDSEGKRISRLAMNEIGKFFQISRLSPGGFAQMVKALKPRIVKSLLTEVRKSQLKAKKLGADFGKQKLA